jgi:hypothetical protein
MPTWLFYSIIASIVLTLVLNIVPRLFPGIGKKAEERFLDQMEDHVSGKPHSGKSGVRVFFPWKWMLAASVLLTLLLNLR